MKLGAVKKDAEIDWAAEFGEDDDEFTVEETPEEDVEVEILLKENRNQQQQQQQQEKQQQPSYSIRNGDVKLASALSVPATSAMTIGRAGGGGSTTSSSDSVSTATTPSSSSASTSTSTTTTSSAYSLDGSTRYAPPMPRIDLDTHQVVEPSPYGAFIEIRTMASTIKIISLVHLVRPLPPPSAHIPTTVARAARAKDLRVGADALRRVR
jgi:hypothetical protein